MLTKTYSTSDPPVTYAYDQATNGIGRLYQIINANVTKTINAYDVMGRVLNTTKTIIGNPTYTTSYTYDKAGKTLTMTYPGVDNFQITYGYLTGTGLLNTVSSGTVTYAAFQDYLPSGKVGKLYQDNGVTLTTNTYDGYSGRLTSLETDKVIPTPSVMIQRKDYLYTMAGDISQIRERAPNKDVTHNYAYDKLHRLTAETAAGGSDPYSNLQPAIVTNTYNTVNGPIHAVAGGNINGSDVIPPYQYDANGNLLSGPDFTNPNNIGTRTIQYNADNKPRNVAHSLGGTMDLDEKWGRSLYYCFTRVPICNIRK